jgi:hypothetical protein
MRASVRRSRHWFRMLAAAVTRPVATTAWNSTHDGSPASRPPSDTVTSTMTAIRGRTSVR